MRPWYSTYCPVSGTSGSATAATALTALDARIELVNAHGVSRVVRYADFVVGPETDITRETDLRAGEVLVAKPIAPARMPSSTSARMRATSSALAARRGASSPRARGTRRRPASSRRTPPSLPRGPPTPPACSNVMRAGAGTAPRLPATIEGAVVSGAKAAGAVLEARRGLAPP